MSLPGPRCSIAQMLGQLNADDEKAVRAALAGKVGATDLSAVLRGNGYRIMPHTIRRHRHDLCACSNPAPANIEKAGSISGALALLEDGGRA
jgi:hypothetical protein